MSADRLTAIDATYLVLESPRVPLHVGSIATFEAGPLLDAKGNLRLAELRRRIGSRLDLLPRLRQRVAPVPFGVARPVWVDDEHFAIEHHVDAVGLPSPHDDGALLRLAGRLFMQPLDRDQPLWHLCFVTGLDHDRVALVERAHHAMLDGVSGVDVSALLLDAAPDMPEGPPSQWRPAPAPGLAQLLVEGIADRVVAQAQVAGELFGSFRHPARCGGVSPRWPTPWVRSVAKASSHRGRR